jgi:hypothetical protein
MSDKKGLSPDWVTGLEGETVTCDQIEHQPSHSGEVFNCDMR